VIREKLQAGLFHLLSIKGTEQPTNIFTKALEQSVFSSTVFQLGMIDLHFAT